MQTVHSMSTTFCSDRAEPSSRRTTAEFSRLIHLIYEAALQPAHWCLVVEQLALSVSANKGLLFTPYLGPQHGGLLFPWNLSEADLQLWATRYIEHDIWSAAARDRGLWIDGAVYADEDLVPREVLEQSLYFREYLCQVGIGRTCACSVLAGAPGVLATAFSVYRPLEDPPFSYEEQDWLRLLIPHLARALGVMHRLDTAKLQAATLLSTLDRLAFGVVLLNQRKEVIHLNEAARTVMGRDDGLAVNTQGKLQAPLKHASRFQQWMDDIQLNQHHPAHFSDRYMVVRSGSSPCCYALQCAPLTAPDGWTLHGEDACYVVFITDPEAITLPDLDRLRAIYGFTDAQAKVACALAGGGSYKSTARQLGIAEDTVRSHVKEVYAKARVNRLPDLVRAVLSLGQANV